MTRSPDSRAIQCIGRAARLELVFEKRRERTILAHAYAEPPYRVGRTFDLDGAAYVIIVCSGPGVFAGDALRQTVHVGPGARVVLTSQSALQVHPAANDRSRDAPFLHARDPALLDHRYVVEDGGELHCQWDPIIPFAGARLEQRFDLRIAPSSRLSWGDAVMAGRVSRGEAWRFLLLQHELRLTVGAALVYLERYALRPAERSPRRAWICGRAPYLATALVHHEGVTAEATEAVHRELTELPGIDAAADLVAPGLLLARLVGENGAPFAAARAACRVAVLRSIFQRAELAGRK